MTVLPDCQSLTELVADYFATDFFRLCESIFKIYTVCISGNMNHISRNNLLLQNICVYILWRLSWMEEKIELDGRKN